MKGLLPSPIAEREKKLKLVRKISENMNVFLQPISLIGNSIDVSAYRAISGLTPISFSTLTFTAADTIALTYVHSCIEGYTVAFEVSVALYIKTYAVDVKTKW